MALQCVFYRMLTKYSENVKITFDSPPQLGDDMYEHNWTWEKIR